MELFRITILLTFCRYTQAVKRLECTADGQLIRDQKNPCKYFHCSHGHGIRKTCPSGIGVAPNYKRGFNNPCTVKNSQCTTKDKSNGQNRKQKQNSALFEIARMMVRKHPSKPEPPNPVFPYNNPPKSHFKRDLSWYHEKDKPKISYSPKHTKYFDKPFRNKYQYPKVLREQDQKQLSQPQSQFNQKQFSEQQIHFDQKQLSKQQNQVNQKQLSEQQSQFNKIYQEVVAKEGLEYKPPEFLHSSGYSNPYVQQQPPYSDFTVAHIMNSDPILTHYDENRLFLDQGFMTPEFQSNTMQHNNAFGYQNPQNKHNAFQTNQIAQTPEYTNSQNQQSTIYDYFHNSHTNPNKNTDTLNLHQFQQHSNTHDGGYENAPYLQDHNNVHSQTAIYQGNTNAQPLYQTVYNTNNAPGYVSPEQTNNGYPNSASANVVVQHQFDPYSGQSDLFFNSNSYSTDNHGHYPENLVDKPPADNYGNLHGFQEPPGNSYLQQQSSTNHNPVHTEPATHTHSYNHVTAHERHVFNPHDLETSKATYKQTQQKALAKLLPFLLKVAKAQQLKGGKYSYDHTPLEAKPFIPHHHPKPNTNHRNARNRKHKPHAIAGSRQHQNFNTYTHSHGDKSHSHVVATKHNNPISRYEDNTHDFRPPNYRNHNSNFRSTKHNPPKLTKQEILQRIVALLLKANHGKIPVPSFQNQLRNSYYKSLQQNSGGSIPNIPTNLKQLLESRRQLNSLPVKTLLQPNAVPRRTYPQKPVGPTRENRRPLRAGSRTSKPNKRRRPGVRRGKTRKFRRRDGVMGKMAQDEDYQDTTRETDAEFVDYNSNLDVDDDSKENGQPTGPVVGTAPPASARLDKTAADANMGLKLDSSKKQKQNKPSVIRDITDYNYNPDIDYSVYDSHLDSSFDPDYGFVSPKQNVQNIPKSPDGSTLAEKQASPNPEISQQTSVSDGKVVLKGTASTTEGSSTKTKSSPDTLSHEIQNGEDENDMIPFLDTISQANDGVIYDEETKQHIQVLSKDDLVGFTSAVKPSYNTGKQNSTGLYGIQLGISTNNNEGATNIERVDNSDVLQQPKDVAYTINSRTENIERSNPYSQLVNQQINLPSYDSELSFNSLLNTDNLQKQFLQPEENNHATLDSHVNDASGIFEALNLNEEMQNSLIYYLNLFNNFDQGTINENQQQTEQKYTHVGHGEPNSPFGTPVAQLDFSDPEDMSDFQQTLQLLNNVYENIEG